MNKRDTSDVHTTTVTVNRANHRELRKLLIDSEEDFSSWVDRKISEELARERRETLEMSRKPRWTQ